MTRPLVGYFDLRGNLPFKRIEIYFLSRRAYGTRFDLIELDPERPIPVEVGTIVANGSDAEVRAALGEMREHGRGEEIGTRPMPRLLRIEYEGAVAHPRGRGRALRSDFEAMRYQAAALYLNRAVPPDALVSSTPEWDPAPRPELVWGEDRQSFWLNDVAVGRLVRVNYSYFPYWHGRGGHVYRGGSERMFVLPSRPSVHASFSRYRSTSVLVGLAVSILMVGWLLREAVAARARARRSR